MGSRLLPPLAAFLFLACLFSPTPAAGRAQATAPAYLAIGDSLAFGVGASSPEQDGYVGLTAEALRDSERFAATGLDVENVSTPGETTANLFDGPDGQMADGLAVIQSRAEDGAEGNEVQIISVSIGANDLLALAEPGQPCRENPGSLACRDALTATLAAVQSNLTEALQELRAAAPEAEIYVTDLYNPYSGTGDEFELIASVGVQQLNGVIRVAAATPGLGVRLVSVFDYFQGRSGQWIAQDGIHPNDDGYRVIAEVLQATIEGRAVSLPADLLAEPTQTPAVTVVERSGVRPVVFWIALPLVFAAGALLSAAYFVVRGRD